MLVLSFFGLIHAFVMTPDGVENRLGFGASLPFAAGYAVAALLLVGAHFYQKNAAQPFVPELLPHADHD